MWLSYLFVLFYLAVAAGAVTHADLFLEKPVKLPFLNIELPLLAFFTLAPILFLIVHAYTLVHLVLLTDKATRFHQVLTAQIGDAAGLPKNESIRRASIRAGLRRQLPSNIFVQFLAGPLDIRDSPFGRLLRAIAWLTLVIAAILLLLLMQIQFLPFHSSFITWTQRIVLMFDLGLLSWLWPTIVSARKRTGARRVAAWAWPGLSIALGACALLFSWVVATFPGEWQEDHLPSWRVLATSDEMGQPTKASLHDWVFNSKVDQTTRRRWLPFSNTLVLVGLNIYEGLGIDDPDKTKWHDTFRVRGRDLRGAIFDFAILPRVDFTQALLQGASLIQAELQSTSLDGAQLQGAKLGGARLQGASLESANLQAASLDGAQLQGANLDYADMKAAVFDNAHLQGSSLEGAQLQAADLSDSQLQGASLSFAQLQGAKLTGSKLEATSLYGAQLQGASLQEALISATQLSFAFLWRTNSAAPTIRPAEGHPQVVSLNNARWGPVWSATGNDTLPWTNEEYHAFKRMIEPIASPPNGWANEMARVSRLDCASADRTLASCDQSAKIPAEADAWRKTLGGAQVDNSTFARAWAQGIKAVLCTGEDNGAFYFAGGRSLRSLDDASIQNSLFALREMTSPNRNHILPAVSGVRAMDDLAPDLIDFIMSKDCLVSIALNDSDKARLLRIKREALQAAGK